jgi:nitroreductase
MNSVRPAVRPEGVAGLTAGQVEAMLQAGMAAPSNLNRQPWRFGCTPSTIELYADLSRALPIADPDNRELRLSCGAALLNLRLAVSAAGRRAEVTVVAERSSPWRIATVRPGEAAPVSPADAALAAAIPHRRTNRRPFRATPVPPAAVHDLRDAAAAEDGVLVVVDEPRSRRQLLELVRSAHRAQQADPAFRDEWARWVGLAEDATEGVPAISAGPAPEPQDDWVLRDFTPATGQVRVPGKDFEPEPLIAVVCSHHDLPSGQVQAGMAMQRVLLTATTLGLVASFVSQPVEVPTQRHQLRELLGGRLWPQTVLRIGYGTPAPPTGRRPLAEVVIVDEERRSS